MARSSELFVGIDPSSRPSIPTACAALTASAEVRASLWARGDEDILRWLRDLGSVRLVAVDGPLKLPGGAEPGKFFDEQRAESAARRSCELELARRGIGCFFTTPRSFVRTWVERCLALAERLRAGGWRVVEAYPYATRRVLWGTGTSVRKSRKESREKELRRLREAGLRWDPGRTPTHHELDAVLCALTALLHERGMTERLGDSADGEIVIPKMGLRWEALLPELLNRGGVDR